MRDILDKLTQLNEGSYWSGNGQYEKQAEELQELVPPSGPAKTLKGEIMRAASKIYYDYHNNGFGNTWPEAATFLMGHVKLSGDVRRMLFEHAMGNMGDGIDHLLEKMMNETVEQIYEMEEIKNTVDMWDTKYNEHDFEPEHDDYYGDEDEDEWD